MNRPQPVEDANASPEVRAVSMTRQSDAEGRRRKQLLEVPPEIPLAKANLGDPKAVLAPGA
jgi:hypothetical protein